MFNFLFLADIFIALANDNRAPEVPDDIAVPAGNKGSLPRLRAGRANLHVEWIHVGAAVPEATLFDDEGNVVALPSASVNTATAVKHAFVSNWHKAMRRSFMAR